MNDRGALRRRLLSGTALATSLVLVTFGVAVYLLVRAALYQQLDHTVYEQAKRVAALVEYDAHGIDLELHRLDGVEYGPTEPSAFYMLWDEHGAVIARSPSLRGGDLPRFGESAVPELRGGQLDDGSAVRMAGVRFVPDVEDGSAEGVAALQLVVAREERPVQLALRQLAWLLAALWAFAVLTTVAVLRWVVGRGLAPAVALADRIASIDPSGTTRAIELPEAPSELQPVVERLNDLLARIEATVTREKSFLGAAAHELRTPLAGLRATLEVALSRPRTAEAYQEALEQCLDLTEAMQRRLDALMLLARLDAGHGEPNQETVALRELVERAFEPIAARAKQRGLELRLRLSPTDSVIADAAELRMVFDNVLDNAVSHASEAGAIDVSASMHDDNVELTITNPCGELAAETETQLFDRFFRGDQARRDDEGHLGLGLSLCRELVVRMGGHIEARSGEGRFVLTVSLPRGEDRLEAAS